jgi:16S rRNA (cytosine967-C5)-methyltransferase
MTVQTALSVVIAAAVQSCEQVLAGRNADAAMSQHNTSRWDPAARSAMRDWTLGSLRHWRANGLLARAAAQRTVFAPETLGNLLTVALYGLRFSRVAPHVVVSQAVEAAEVLGIAHTKGLVNGVLRGYLRRKVAFDQQLAEAPIAHQLSYPDWWVERVAQDWPQPWQEILAAGNEKPPMAIRVNRRKIAPDAYFSSSGQSGRRFASAGILLDAPMPTAQLSGFAAGEVSVQDAGAQLCVEQLQLVDGQRVLDACSAPGGKSAAIAEMAEVTLIALDNDSARQRSTSELLARLGLPGTVRVGDAATPASWWDGTPFDRILLDAPCTASGVIRRHADGKWLKRATDLPALVALQRAMLDALWPLLKPGGMLLYVTCSVFRDENDRQIAHFLSHHPDAQQRPVVWPRGVGASEPGQLLPGGAASTHNHDGFFCAQLWKV